MRVPLLGQQQQPTPEQQEQMAKMQIVQAVNQLSMGIYVQLATPRIDAAISLSQEIDENKLQSLARTSQLAAKAFFEGIGVIQTQSNSEKECN